MKKNYLSFLVALSLSTTLACSSCKTTGGIGEPSPVTNVVECVKEDIAPQVQDIVTEVISALSSNDWLDLLNGMVHRVGKTVVDCAVAEVFGMAQQNLKAAPSDTLSNKVHQNAKKWLSQ